MARYDARQVGALLGNPGIIRNRQKILAAINNARRFLEVQGAFGSFAAYMWRFVGGKPIVHEIRALGDYPATSAESDAMSKDLRQRGFKFVRGFHNMLRPHAGHGNGERSHLGLFPPTGDHCCLSQDGHLQLENTDEFSSPGKRGTGLDLVLGFGIVQLQREEALLSASRSWQPHRVTFERHPLGREGVH